MSVTHQLFGYPIMAVTMSEVVEYCDGAIRGRKPIQIGVLNAAKIVNATRDRQLRDAVLSCDIIVADGQSVVWASRLLGCPLPERVTGIDLMARLLELADQKALSVYLLGAQQDVIESVDRVVAERYPNARVAGYRNGFFADSDAHLVAEEIAQAQPDMLFLGITSPKKEIFLEKYHEMLGVPVSHGVGGSFDILAGVTKRAPLAWQRLGLEWAYRLVQEPGRMWRRYLTTNTAFILLVMRELLQRLTTERHAHPSVVFRDEHEQSDGRDDQGDRLADVVDPDGVLDEVIDEALDKVVNSVVARAEIVVSAKESSVVSQMVTVEGLRHEPMAGAPAIPPLVVIAPPGVTDPLASQASGVPTGEILVGTSPSTEAVPVGEMPFADAQPPVERPPLSV